MQDRVLLSFILGLVFGITTMLFWSENETDTRLVSANESTTPQHETESVDEIVPVSTSTEPEWFEFRVGSHKKKSKKKMQVLLLAALPGSLSETISKEMVDVVWQPYEDVPSTAVESIEHVTGKYLKPNARVGDVITGGMLADHSGAFSQTGERLPGIFQPINRFPTGPRLVSVSIEGSSNYLNSIRPRDKVDFFCVYHSCDEQGIDVLRMKRFLTGIEVFGIDQIKSNHKLRNVSVKVTPHQAQILMLAMHKGIITVALTPSDQDQQAVNSGAERTRPTN